MRSCGLTKSFEWVGKNLKTSEVDGGRELTWHMDISFLPERGMRPLKAAHCQRAESILSIFIFIVN